jgi:DMSO/TMAO reductase YedYZ molybdopterin-dependent catalytic subunit
MKDMKLRMFLFAIAVTGALALSIGRTDAQDKAKHETKPAPEMQEMMKKWMEIATPGEGHKFLDQFVGKWDVISRMWLEGPDKPPSETKGLSESKWILEGRFLLEEATGQMMGMPYKSMNFIGFDNYKKKYIVSYMDNLGTGLYTGEGKLDPSNKVLTMFGKMDDYMTGENDKPVKYVTRIISKDKHVFEVYDEVGNPKEYKVAEIIYTRKQ